MEVVSVVRTDVLISMVDHVSSGAGQAQGSTLLGQIAILGGEKVL
jgi:hypothetical protein